MFLGKHLFWRIATAGTLTLAALAEAQNRSPLLLVVSRGENSLAFVDAQTGKLVGRIATGLLPHQVVVSSDGKLAFVSNTSSGSPETGRVIPSISVIDIASRKELRRVKIGPRSRPHDMVFAGGKLYFTAEGYKLIGCYDPATDEIEWLLGNGQNRTTMMAVNQEVTKIYATNIGSGTVTVMEQVPVDEQRNINTLWTLGVDWTVSQLSVGKQPQGIDISPDGKELWIAHLGNGGIWIIDIATQRVKEKLDVPTEASTRMKFVPGGELLLIVDRNGDELVVLDPSARKEVKRLKMDHPQELLITPDGSRAYVVLADENRIAVIDLKTLEVTGYIPSHGTEPEGMAWVDAS
jgi:YVTN family beta-propeller protein